MGGKKNPIADILNVASKGLEDTLSTGGDIIGAVGKGVDDSAKTVVKGIEDTGKQIGRLDKIILSPTNEAEEKAKSEAKRDAAQREAALRDQKEAESNLRRAEASNVDANRGSSIILGRGKKKGKKAGSVSTGMGLSKGKTGLQT